MALAIEAEGIFKTFRSGWRGKKEKLVLKGINLQIEAGEIFGILGPNGAGTTTIINMVLGILEPTAGSIRIEGMDIAAHRRQALEAGAVVLFLAQAQDVLPVLKHLTGEHDVVIQAG